MNGNAGSGANAASSAIMNIGYSTSWAVQLSFDWYNAGVWYRANENGTWNSWLKLLDETDRPEEYVAIACSGETTDLEVATGVATFRAPYAMTITKVRASVATAPTDANIIVDINDSGNSIMTTNKLSIDATEKTSVTATTAAGVTDTSIADDAEITIDVDQIGSTIAGAGLKVVIYYTRT